MVCSVENKLPKILIANHLYMPDIKGGAEVMVHQLACGLRQRGVDVEVITTCDLNQKSVVEDVVDGVKVTRFHPPNLYWANDKSPRSRLRKLAWRTIASLNLVAAWRFARILRKIRPDIVHTHNIAYFSPLIFPLIRWSGAKVVHTAHDYYIVCPLWTLVCQNSPQAIHRAGACKPYRAWTLGLMQGVDVFAAPSQSLIDGHLPFFRRRPRITVLRNGTNLPDFGAAPKPSRHDGRTRFLFLGQMIPEKGVEVMLNAIMQIPRDAPVEFHIAGSGPLQTRIEDAATTDPRIHFHGFVKAEAKTQLLAMADVMLFPSIWPENAPIAILEAMAAGMTIIGSDIGGVPELVRHDSNGLLVVPNDADDLAKAITLLSDDAELRGRLQARSQERSADFSVERMVDNYIELYSSVHPGKIESCKAKVACAIA